MSQEDIKKSYLEKIKTIIRFNKKYENPKDKIKKDKGNKIIKKFKELFK